MKATPKFGATAPMMNLGVAMVNRVSVAWLLLHHLERGFGERLAHQGEGLRAAEIMVAGVRCPAFPQRGLGGRYQFGLELLPMLPLLFRRHVSVGVGVVFVFRVEVVAHLAHLVVFLVNG